MWNGHWDLRSGHVGWLQPSPSHHFESEAVTFVVPSRVWQIPKFSIQPTSTNFNKDIPVERCRNPYQLICERQKGHGKAKDHGATGVNTHSRATNLVYHTRAYGSTFTCTHATKQACAVQGIRVAHMRCSPHLFCHIAGK